MISSIEYIFIILDGASEDILSSSPTSLHDANTPFIDRLTGIAHCGFFDPHDPILNVVQTDLVVANLLGIRPLHWPGRAFYEAVHLDSKHRVPSACAFLRFQKQVDSPQAQEPFAHQFSELVEKVAGSYSVMSRLRSHERHANSYLLWVPNESSDAVPPMQLINQSWSELSFSLPNSIRLTLDQTWHGKPGRLQRFCYGPCLLGFTNGSLAGLCDSAYITNWQYGSPLDTEHLSALFSTLEASMHADDWRTIVVYFKGPDWASHQGDRKLKIALIEFIDKQLNDILSSAIDHKGTRTLLISDHRTNIGSPSSSKSPSPFLLVNGDPNNALRFTEKAISKVWQSEPLDMSELRQRFFYRNGHHANTRDFR